MQNQNQDIEKLRIAAQLVLDFYEGLKRLKPPNLPFTLFKALALLTLERAEQGVELEDIRFTPKELREKFLAIGSLKKSKSEDAEWVRKNWKVLEKELEEEQKSPLQNLSRSKGQEFYPWIKKDESKGGQGNSSAYYLIAQYLNEQEKIETKQYDCPEGGLHYVQESLARAPRLARWIDGFVFQGWQRYAYVLPLVLTLFPMIFFVWLLLMQGLYNEISTVKWLTSWIIALSSVAIVLSSPLYRVKSNRIVMASDWMTPLKKSNVQLELKKVGTDSETGKDIRELRLVIYSAKCPICEGRVEVEGGGIQFPFRLVGKCIESPREHIFSFDHITLIGKPLL